MPMKSTCGAAAAIVAVALPMPKPISTASGATRPKTRAKSTGSSTNGSTKRGASVASARACPGPIRPARTTKLRMRGGAVAAGLADSGSGLSFIAAPRHRERRRAEVAAYNRRGRRV